MNDVAIDRHKLRIALVSDYFFPNMGGVETHLYHLAQGLLERGHRVVIVTHSYVNHVGIRYMANGLKVYYLSILPFYNNNILPTICSNVPILRHVILAENIQIVHGHSAFSSLAHEALWVAGILGRGTVFTDHSLFGFADLSAVVTNAALKCSLSTVDRFICVSHTGKENTVLRSGVPQDRVHVIPNAVDSNLFQPCVVYPQRRRDRVTVVLCSRLVYRKGVDLLAEVLPRICARQFAGRVRVDFVIAGDGPKRTVIEEAVELNGLQSRVSMLGEISNSDVREKALSRGDIFLNTSLTEAFCMAIIEAASCGLIVVSTRVGGIPEVLPPPYIHFVEPDAGSIEAGLVEVVENVIAGRIPDPWEAHNFIKEAYCWRDVARRTELVYHLIRQERMAKKKSLARCIRLVWESGRFSGPLMSVLYLFCHYWIILINFWSGVKPMDQVF